MKTYLIVTGVLFLAITVAHFARMAVEPSVARDPWYLLLTAIAASLAGWAWRLHATLRRQA